MLTLTVDVPAHQSRTGEAFTFSQDADTVALAEQLIGMADTVVSLPGTSDWTFTWDGALATPVTYGVCDYCRFAADDAGEPHKIVPLAFDISAWAEDEGYPYADRGCWQHAEAMAESLYCWHHDC